MNSTIETLGQSLDHWQALYIISITVAVLSTVAIIICAFHIQEHLLALKVSNYVYVAASLFAVITTIVIVNKTKSLDTEKDRQVASNNAAAQVQIETAKKVAAQALADAATANQKAEDARLKAENTSKENFRLRLDVSKEQKEARNAESELGKQNAATSQFTQALALQQQTMEQQIHTSPQLNSSQIDAVAIALTSFAGQEVIIHQTADTVVGRLGRSIAMALDKAHIKFPSYSTDMGTLYQGVSVVVHSDQGHPPLADALVNTLRQQGISVTPAALEAVPVGKVALYLGPQ